MNRSLVRGAIGTAIACGAFVTGPLTFDAVVANAGTLGLGGGGHDINVAGVEAVDGGSRTAVHSGARVNAVSTAPSARTVVIRSKPVANEPVSEVVPVADTAIAGEPAAAALSSSPFEAVPAAPPPAAPASVPRSVTPPSAPVLEAPAPQALPATTTNEPGPAGRVGPADSFSPKTKVPDGFRVGYAQYLRTATDTDLLVAAVPGVAGIAGFTLLGAYAGYRQAKAVQRALLAPVPTSILL